MTESEQLGFLVTACKVAIVIIGCLCTLWVLRLLAVVVVWWRDEGSYEWSELRRKRSDAEWQRIREARRRELEEEAPDPTNGGE